MHRQMVGFRCCSTYSHEVVVDPRDRSTRDPLFSRRRRGQEGSPHPVGLDPPLPGKGEHKIKPWEVALADLLASSKIPPSNTLPDSS